MIDPKEMIKKLTVEELIETAEDYFASIANPAPQMAKPFSNLLEAPELLQNMGILLSGLKVGKTMTVLEFGAGTCWFSKYLNQAQCVTVSCDVSKTALDIGKRLFAESPIIGEFISEPRFLHFNGRKIDLPNKSVDRIVCFDAFHHIPNQVEVLSEFARVLKPGGIAGFSEPGRFHSQAPQSQYEMKNYKVLENDILLSEIFAVALECGFTDLKVKLVNDMELTINDYQSLTENIPNQVLEYDILGNARNTLINKTIFFLHKGVFAPDSRSHIGLSHSITMERSLFSVKAGEDLCIPLRVSNVGDAKWLNENINGIGVVNIGTHLYDEQNNLINLDYSRHALKDAVESGEAFEQDIKVRFSDVGNFVISIDLVSEGVCWFENVGSKALRLQVNVS